MRKILKGFVGVPVTLLLVAMLAAGGALAYTSWKDSQAKAFASSVISEDSPIAELATRKIVWKAVHVESTSSVDSVRETVFTMKVGYDLTAVDNLVVDDEAKTVKLTLPAPKIIAIDHFMQRTTQEKKSFVERMLGHGGDDGRADREDIVQLASDCEKFQLLSAKKLRQTLATFIRNRLRDVSGYELVLNAGLDIPAKVMFNAYLEEKGVPFRLP